MANQKGVTFTATDKWTDPTVGLFKDRHYTRIGLWTSIAISRTTVRKYVFKFQSPYALSYECRLTTRKLCSR